MMIWIIIKMRLSNSQIKILNLLNNKNQKNKRCNNQRSNRRKIKIVQYSDIILLLNK